MPKNYSRSQIDWDHIGEEDFNTVVEVLLLKMYDCDPYRAEVLRGAGGDGGIDVAVYHEARVVKIFQLKFFPEGFTGGLRDTRRRQIRKSFETAWDKHSPEEWVLVMPPNPHMHERNYIQGLAENKQVNVDIWGKTKLAAALTDHPEVERAFVRDELVEQLERIHQEKAGLVGNTDLSERAAGLIALANSRSKYWDTKVFAQGEVIIEDYVPKHPDAMEKEPIRTEVTFRFGPEHTDLENQMRAGQDYGLLDDLMIPEGVASMSRTGPSWVAPLPPGLMSSRAVVTPAFDAAEADLGFVTLVIRDDCGYTRGTHEGRVLRMVRGTIGWALRSEFHSVLTLTFRFPYQSSGEEPRCEMFFSGVGATARNVQAAIGMVESLKSGQEIHLYLKGRCIVVLKLNKITANQESDVWTSDLVDDLVTIERFLPGASFAVPYETTKRQRIDIRIARLLLEGYSTALVPKQKLSAVLSGESGPEMEKMLQEQSAIVVRHPSFPVEILGNTYNLGPVTIYHPCVEVDNGREAWSALTAGEAAGRAIDIRSADGTPFRAWLQSSEPTKETDAVPFRAWGVHSIDDPPLEAPTSMN